MLPSSLLAEEEKMWEEKQRNAVQTELPNLTGLVSFASCDLMFAQSIESYFPTLSLRFEQNLVDPHCQSDELRIVVLSPAYAHLPNALSAAVQAAKNSQLVIFLLGYDDDGAEEQWTELTHDREWAFSGPTALRDCELYLLKTKSAVDYSAVVQIDDYVVEKELGFGAQGVVYLAKHSETGKLFAVKEIRNAQKNASMQTKNEIAVMKRLDHVNVAKLFSVFAPETSSSLFLVLEYVEGGSFGSDNAIWNGTLPPLEDIFRAQNVFQQLVRGVMYLHRMGVLHRDIKPSNILGYRDRGTVKLSDFGVSSFTNTSKSVRVLGEDDVIYVGSSGTPAFLPPEASGASLDVVYNGRGGDVWSLGVTFYVLLTGRLPFRGADRAETAHLICIQQDVKFPKRMFPPASLLHRQCKDLILKMLEKDANRRITMAGVCDHAFLGQVAWREEHLLSIPSLSSGAVSEAFSYPKTFSQRVKRKSVALRNMVMTAGRKVANTSVVAEENDAFLLQTATAAENTEITLGERIAQWFYENCACSECCGGGRLKLE